MSDEQWCSVHEDRRVYVGETTSRGEVVKVYADEWTPNCQWSVGTGLFVKDGHEPSRTR